MKIIDDLKDGKKKIAIIGLGYVGLPLAIAFDKVIDVIGYDIDNNKINMYRSGFDPTCEIGSEGIKASSVLFTSNANDLNNADIFIVTVPTPINQDKTPDLRSITEVSHLVSRYIKHGSVVIYESTVYPGVTEDICVPILEEGSGLKCRSDFEIGYSPERINPGDKINRLENIKKIVSAGDEVGLEKVAGLYELIIKAGVHRVSNIKVAEAAKVVENSQRDINIAYMNEIAMVFDLMDIDTKEVIEAMNTKWNALGFTPGLVGGHCIGVDPYYFIYKAERLGYHSQIIMSGRKINDSMARFIADATIREMIMANKLIRGSKVYIFGLTFKENTGDIRNSKVFDIIHHLKEYGISPIVVDPHIYGINTDDFDFDIVDLNEVKNADCLLYAVAHKEFKELTEDRIKKMFSKGKGVLIDVKGIFDRRCFKEDKFSYWRL